MDSALKVQGLALFFTAIYETFHQQLTLFHAICILHLLSLLGFGLTASEKYGRKGRIGWGLQEGAQIVISSAFIAFLGYI